MKLFLNLAFIGCLLTGTTLAQSPVTLTIKTRSPGYAIPADFCGLSFGAVTELPGHGGVSGLLFSATNMQLVTLFKNAGLHNLRLGGSTVDGLDAAIPGKTAMDNVFAFARAVGDLDVIYSLRLLNGSTADDAATAQYIWQNYRPLLACLAIGNEPELKSYLYPPFGTGTDPAITNYTSYLADWRKFAAAITHAVPGATFAGPDAASQSWARLFAKDEKRSGILAVVTQHFYVGGRRYIKGKTGAIIPVQQAIDNMLSTNWVATKYPSFCLDTLTPVVAEGLPCRLTESDDYLKGITNASDAFASALWALDYMHWWAAHGCAGVNFHNTEWLKTDTVYLDSSGNYQINPKAYGIKAFDLGGHGRMQPLTMSNTNALNLTAYAVRSVTNLFVTIINKEHGPGARDAAVTIKSHGISKQAEVIFLTAPNGNVGATSGMTLGGATITNNAPWLGKWTPLVSDEAGQCVVKVPATAAAVVKISAR